MIAECPNVDEFAFLPTLDDLLDAVEVIRVRRENEARALHSVNSG